MAFTAEGPRAVVLRGDDTVAVAARPLPRGFLLETRGNPIEIREPIGLGHKVALADIAPGEAVRKYGQIIGFASKAIPAGSLVHVHNLKADLFERDYAFATETPAAAAPGQPRTFRGYLRPDGRVGTRNYVAVISTVNCSASTSRYVADRFRDNLWRKDFPNVDGVFAITHKGGCGLPFEGPDHKILERVLAGFANHPNVAAYVIVGLGCEVSFAQHLVDAQDLVTLGAAKGNGHRKAGPRPRMLNIQEEGGITRTVESAARAVYDLLPEANSWTRTEQPASKICLAMECGGSDGNSGVTANPALGVAADLLIAQGGSAVLGETTEIYGAEHLLTRRAVSREVGQKLVDRIKWWEWYTGSLRRPDRQQPVARQQGRRPDDDLRKVARCARQGGFDRPGRRRSLCGQGRWPRADFHGYARLRPAVHDRAHRRRGQRAGLHDRTRKRSGAETDTVHQARDQHADVRADDRRHGYGRRPDPGRRASRGRRTDGSST